MYPLAPRWLGLNHLALPWHATTPSGSVHSRSHSRPVSHWVVAPKEGSRDLFRRFVFIFIAACSHVYPTGRLGAKKIFCRVVSSRLIANNLRFAVNIQGTSPVLVSWTGRKQKINKLTTSSSLKQFLVFLVFIILRSEWPCSSPPVPAQDAW